MREGTLVVRKHSQSLGRSIASSCGRPTSKVWHPSDRSLHRSTRRDQLVYLGLDVHRVLTVRPTVLVEGLVLDVMDCIACCAVVPLILALSAVTDCTNSMQEFRVAPEHGMSPRGYNWTQMLVASITPVPGCSAKAVMRASLLLARSRP